MKLDDLKRLCAEATEGPNNAERYNAEIKLGRVARTALPLLIEVALATVRATSGHRKLDHDNMPLLCDCPQCAALAALEKGE